MEAIGLMAGGVANILTARVGYPDIRFETEPAPELLNLSCSPVHINKCIVNLVTNAAEAVG